MPQEDLGQILVERTKSKDSIIGDFRTLKDWAAFNFGKAKGSRCTFGLIITIQPLMYILPKVSQKECDEILTTMGGVSSPHTALSILNDFLEKWPEDPLANAIGGVARRFVDLFN